MTRSGSSGSSEYTEGCYAGSVSPAAAVRNQPPARHTAWCWPSWVDTGNRGAPAARGASQWASRVQCGSRRSDPGTQPKTGSPACLDPPTSIYVGSVRYVRATEAAGDRRDDAPDPAPAPGGRYSRSPIARVRSVASCTSDTRREQARVWTPALSSRPGRSPDSPRRPQHSGGRPQPSVAPQRRLTLRHSSKSGHSQRRRQ